MLPVTAGIRQSLLKNYFSVCDSGVIFTFAARAGSHCLRLTWLAESKSYCLRHNLYGQNIYFHFVSISQCFTIVNNNKDYNISYIILKKL